ncbi:hypothetical protein CEXT_418761 [Caerostris extrusa]|uniref:Uncharacterized protein n=1 Tax=Caerostris extrusa TaxID=172846 RepID=A0AAV4TGR2_CAEEX|nr:hypothetical protein CEXT_418761 [Caerostris extrusa]
MGIRPALFVTGPDRFIGKKNVRTLQERMPDKNISKQGTAIWPEGIFCAPFCLRLATSIIQDGKSFNGKLRDSVLLAKDA